MHVIDIKDHTVSYPNIILKSLHLAGQSTVSQSLCMTEFLLWFIKVKKLSQLVQKQANICVMTLQQHNTTQLKTAVKH